MCSLVTQLSFHEILHFFTFLAHGVRKYKEITFQTNPICFSVHLQTPDAELGGEDPAMFFFEDHHMQIVCLEM